MKKPQSNRPNDWTRGANRNNEILVTLAAGGYGLEYKKE